MGLGSLCYLPPVAVEVLMELVEEGGKNQAAGQLTGYIKKVRDILLADRMTSRNHSSDHILL